MPHEVSNTDNVIDSRDVIARIEDLQAEYDAMHSGLFVDGATLTEDDQDDSDGGRWF